MGRHVQRNGWKGRLGDCAAGIDAGDFPGYQFVTFCGAAPLQEAAAIAIGSAGLPITTPRRNRDVPDQTRYARYRSASSAGTQATRAARSYSSWSIFADLGFRERRGVLPLLTTETACRCRWPSAFITIRPMAQNLALCLHQNRRVAERCRATISTIAPVETQQQ